MATFEEWTLFLASPGDVTLERDIVRKVVEELNDSLGRLAHIRVRVVGWDTDARPAWGADAQKILNGQIGDMKQHALFVGIFWNRIGTKTPRAQSGTIEEFKNAARLPKRERPEISLYFNQKPATLNAAQAKQRVELLEWKEGLQSDGLYWDFNGHRNFETLFRRHYGSWLLERIERKIGSVGDSVSLPIFKSPTDAVRYLENQTAKKTTPNETLPKPPPKPRTPKTSVSKGQPILLDGHLFLARSVIESGSGSQWTIEITPQTPADDHKIRALRDQQRHYATVPLAYQLQGGSATIDGCKRYSDQNGDLWTVQIRFTPAGLAGHEVNVNGMSTDEIAQKRAEWLLLAQKPNLETQAQTQSAWGMRTHSNSRWIESHIMGSGRDNEPIFPALWKRCGSDRAAFSSAAELWAVHRLLSTNVCQSIDTLKVSPIRAGKVSVIFHGRRASPYHGQEPIEISVKGQCVLGE